MKKKFYLLLVPILLALPSLLLAQAETFVFEGNNFRWNQSTNGSLFFNETEGLPGMEVPIDEGNHAIFASTLLLGGIDPGENLKISFRQYCQNDNENCAENWGPLKADGSFHSSQEASQYNKIWFISIDDINLHSSFFECVINPDCDETIEYPNYEIPEDILSWPAEGNEGFADYLAPFVDFNGDGSYTPQSGDYPAICGDFSSYTIWNDLGANGSSMDGEEIGVEIHTIVYGYDATESAEFNTLFVQHKLINRSTQLLSETFAGFWNDFDLGNATDDFIGTDVERSMIYVYNGDDFDEVSTSGPGYGSDLPMLGVKVLSGALIEEDGIDDVPEFAEFYANETAGFSDGIIDNERRGLYSSMYHNSASGPNATRAPQIGIEYYNYMKNVWRDNTPLSFGGSGYVPGDVNVTLAKFVFPGESDPLLAGTDGVDPNYPFDGGWTEENEGNAGGDRRTIGSSGPFTFAPGDVQYIDLAYIFARESFDDEETVIETLQRFADEVEGMQCDPLPAIVLSTDRAEERKPLKVFPNPSSGSISFELNENTAQLTMIDITGKVVRQEILNSGLQRIEVSDLADGIYLIQVQADQSIYHGKVVVDK